MPLSPARRPNIQKLVDALSSADAQPRESAAARLTIIGLPAAPALRALVAAETAATTGRVAALRTLAGIPGAGAAVVAAGVLASRHDALAIDGIDVLRALLHDSADEAEATVALEHLTQLAMSTAAPTGRRLTAIDALAGLPEALLTPIHATLADDRDPAVAARVRTSRQGETTPIVIADVLLGGGLPDAPAALGAAVRGGATASAADLRRLIDLVRARERHEQDAGHDDRRAAWALVRGQLHHTLAQRGSHVALADLRQTLERRDEALSADFLAAAAILAGADCLDALAQRWVTTGEGDRWLREQLEQAVRAVIERERLTRTDPVLIQLLTRLPASGPLVAIAPKKARTTRRPRTN